MLFEHRFETKTSGLVCGQALLTTDRPSYVPIRRGLILEPLPILWKPVVVSYKIEIRAREGGEVLWVRPFATEIEAAIVYARLIGLDLERLPLDYRLPGIWQDGELEYHFATVATFNSSVNNSGVDWGSGGSKCPTGVSATDYLVISGGGGAAASGGGGYTGTPGAGAGGYLPGTSLAVTAGTNYPVVVGAKGVGGTSALAAGTAGTASTFISITTGVGGAYSNTSDGGAHNNGVTGGSGSGARAGGTVGAGTASQGNDGGAGHAGGTDPSCGGGGGSGAVGGAASANVSGNGGAGTASSISGSSVTRAGGGGGGAYAGQTAGSAGSGGAGSGGASANAGAAATANTGSGGGGAGGANLGTYYNGGNGADGIVILSFTPATYGKLPFQKQTIFFKRRF